MIPTKILRFGHAHMLASKQCSSAHQSTGDKLLVIIDEYGCPVHLSSRTYWPDFLFYGPSRYRPVASSESAFKLCKFQYTYAPLSGRSRSGSAPSPTIVPFGKFCMQMRLTLVRLDHSPPNPMRRSSETSSNRHGSRSHGRHGLFETYRASRLN